MRHAVLGAWPILVASIAGSIASPAAVEPPSATASPDVATLAPTLLAWEGHIVAGAAMDAPAHLAETRDAVMRPLMSAGFELHVAEAPGALEPLLDRDRRAAAAMVTEPHGDGPLQVYESAASDRLPICFAIPAAALREGVWNVMAHSEVVVNTALTFDVALTGGAAEIVDTPADVPAAQFPVAAATRERAEPLPCAAAGG